MGYPRIVVRAFSPAGLYPTLSVAGKDAAYIDRGDLIFTACRVHGVELEGCDNLERPWLSPEEIALLGAMLLSPTLGTSLFFPLEEHAIIQDCGQDLSEAASLAAVEAVVRGLAPVRTLHVIPPPAPCNGGPPYERRDVSAEEQELCRELVGALRSSDYLAVRGVGALLKGQMLSRHWPFHVEACGSLHVSRDATFEVIQARLRQEGRPHSSRDCMSYVHTAFGEEHSGLQYFEEFYGQRNMIVHAQSKGRAYPDVPLEADDYYDLYDGLVAVWRFLLIGKAIP